MKKRITGMLIICFLMSMLMNYLHVPVGYYAKAMEYNQFVTYLNEDIPQESYGNWTWKSSYYEACHADLTGEESVVFCRAGVGYQMNKWKIFNSQAGFDITTLPENIEIIGMRIVAEVLTDWEHPVWGTNNWVSWYRSLEVNGATGNNDFDNAIDKYTPKNRVGAPVNQSSYDVADTVVWEIGENDWEYMTTPTTFAAGDRVWVMYSTEYQMLDWEPGVGSDGSMYMSLRVGNDDGRDVRLEIDYIGEASPRTMTDPDDEDYHENAPIDTTILGDEVADNITWSTLRCLYGDEYPELIVSGNSGAELDLVLYNQAGGVLSSKIDSIRTDDKFAWKILDIPSTYTGFIRVKEINFGLVSPWGYIALSPDSSQGTNKIYAKYTSYPQYGVDFYNYVTNRGGLLFYHWKTTIDGGSDNLSALSLRVWPRGNYSREVYDRTLAYLADNYFQGTSDFNEANIHWRYAIFTPQMVAGQDGYSGLVQDIDIYFDIINTGFIQTVISSTENVTDEYTVTHSAYWYLTDESQGINISSKYANYAVNDDIEIQAVIGKESNVPYDIGAVKLEIYDDDGLAKTGYFNAGFGENIYVLNGFEEEGDYTARVYFYSDTKTYQYVKDVDFTVSGDVSGAVEPEVGDIWDNLTTWLKNMGMDNTKGHWIFIILGMVLTFILFFKSEILRVIVPLLVFGMGILFGWVDIWIIALLALGAGITIFAILRKRISGGGGGDE